MPIPFKLEYVIEKILSEHSQGHRRALRKLAGVKLSTSEAGRAWPRILEHKWFLSERLGRDVGLRVAAVDYFENIQTPRPSSFFQKVHDKLPLRLPMMQPLSERLNS
jgi:hypothetical protein